MESGKFTVDNECIELQSFNFPSGNAIVCDG